MDSVKVKRVSDQSQNDSVKSFDSPETMQTVESLNVQTPRGGGLGADSAERIKVTPTTAPFQAGEAFALLMRDAGDGDTIEVSAIPSTPIRGQIVKTS